MLANASYPWGIEGLSEYIQISVVDVLLNFFYGGNLDCSKMKKM